jgi:hypothetical protein
MRARRWIVGLVAMVAVVPVGFAVARTTGLDERTGQDDPPPQERLVPATECDDEANAAWEAVGMPRDSYYPGCPSVEKATQQAEYFNELRRRGLTAIAEAIKRHGDSPADAAELASIEAELERLGGPLGHPYAEARDE